MLIVSLLVCYTIGSISTSTLLSRMFANIDIREHGSGNAGATNMVRVLGWKWGLLVLAADILKGMIAIILAWTFGHGNPWFTFLSGLAVIIGHNWPVFFGFRGGKGIATTIGVFVLTIFLPALLAGVIAITVLIVTRIVSLAALTFTLLTPLFVVWLEPHRPGALTFSVIVAAMSVLRHRRNIERLLRGQEHRIFSKRY